MVAERAGADAHLLLAAPHNPPERARVPRHPSVAWAARRAMHHSPPLCTVCACATDYMHCNMLPPLGGELLDRLEGERDASACACPGRHGSHVCKSFDAWYHISMLCVWCQPVLCCFQRDHLNARGRLFHERPVPPLVVSPENCRTQTRHPHGHFAAHLADACLRRTEGALGDCPTTGGAGW